MKFLPNTSKEYPLRFFIYWLIIWALLFLYSTVMMLPKISNNGHVVRKDVCLEEGTTGRFDEYTKCLEYGKPNYVPVGEELINNFKNYGFGSFIVVLFIGWILRNGQKIEERKNKKQFNEDLTDKRIINFLYSIYPEKPEKGEEYYEEYRSLYKKLNKGKPLEEVFRKDKTGYGPILIAEKISDNFYEIEFGIGWEESGTSYTRKVTFDENDSATCGDDVTINEYGG